MSVPTTSLIGVSACCRSSQRRAAGRRFAAVRRLRERGIVPAVGHTDATYAQTLEAVEAGASVATHLFNGMRPPHHREPGPALALLEAPGVVCELILDGVHLHEALARHVVRTAGTDRVALVSDAIS